MVTLTIPYLSFIRLPRRRRQLIYNEIRLDSLNVPGNCLLKETMTQKWEPSAEKIYVRDGMLKEDANMALLLEEVAFTDVTSKLLISKFTMR